MVAILGLSVTMGDAYEISQERVRRPLYNPNGQIRNTSGWQTLTTWRYKNRTNNSIISGLELENAIFNDPNWTIIDYWDANRENAQIVRILYQGEADSDLGNEYYDIPNLEAAKRDILADPANYFTRFNIPHELVRTRLLLLA